MPVPRRKIHVLATDKAGVIPVYHEAPKERPSIITRCQRCKCRLAQDQTQHYCSPCQRRLSDTPDAIADYLS